MSPSVSPSGWAHQLRFKAPSRSHSANCSSNHPPMKMLAGSGSLTSGGCPFAGRIDSNLKFTFSYKVTPCDDPPILITYALPDMNSVDVTTMWLSDEF